MGKQLPHLNVRVSEVMKLSQRLPMLEWHTGNPSGWRFPLLSDLKEADGREPAYGTPDGKKGKVGWQCFQLDLQQRRNRITIPYKRKQKMSPFLSRAPFLINVPGCPSQSASHILFVSNDETPSSDVLFVNQVRTQAHHL